MKCDVLWVALADSKEGSGQAYSVIDINGQRFAVAQGAVSTHVAKAYDLPVGRYRTNSSCRIEGMDWGLHQLRKDITTSLANTGGMVSVGIPDRETLTDEFTTWVLIDIDTGEIANKFDDDRFCLACTRESLQFMSIGQFGDDVTSYVFKNQAMYVVSDANQTAMINGVFVFGRGGYTYHVNQSDKREGMAEYRRREGMKWAS